MNQADFGNIVGQWGNSRGVEGRIVAAYVGKEGIMVYLRSDKGLIFVYKLDDVSIRS